MRILIVDDQPVLTQQLKSALEGANFVVDTAAEGEDGHFLGEHEAYDTIILDLGLPKMDGLTVLKKWREAGVKTPVLVLTARSSWSDKVEGLDSGADDYMTKPFHKEELISRIRALVRRSTGNTDPVITCGPVRFDTRSQQVTVDGQDIHLTAQELKLLSYLMHHKGKVISRSELTDHIYDQDFDRDSNTIEVFITRVRKKLGVNIIKTIRRMGYSVAD